MKKNKMLAFIMSIGIVLLIAGCGREHDTVGADNSSFSNEYSVPNSFSIVGKWKSVGEEGFGQAQPGTMIVFDDANCNFYSPRDTYAFYDNGDKYVLDITSILGENLSFTVDIIDNDNMDIKSGALVTKLTRVT